MVDAHLAAGRAHPDLGRQGEQPQAIAEQHVILGHGDSSPLIGVKEAESHGGRPPPDRAGVVASRSDIDPPNLSGDLGVSSA